MLLCIYQHIKYNMYNKKNRVENEKNNIIKNNKLVKIPLISLLKMSYDVIQQMKMLKTWVALLTALAFRGHC